MSNNSIALSVPDIMVRCRACCSLVCIIAAVICMAACTVTQSVAARDFTTSIEGGRGLMLMQTARTYGRGAVVTGLYAFAGERPLDITGPDGTIERVTDLPVVIGMPLGFGLTDEIDLELSVYGYHNGRTWVNQYNINRGYSEPETGIGSTRAGVKIRLPFKPESRIQIAGRFTAVMATSKGQVEGLNYRWTRTGTDIETSIYESFALTPSFGLHLEQGYVLSGSDRFDDQVVASVGMSWAASERLRFQLEFHNRTFLGKGPQSVKRAGTDADAYYELDGVPAIGNIMYVKDDEPDYWEDAMTLIPSLSMRFGGRVIVSAGARINIADQQEPKETVQGLFSLNFLTEIPAMVDSDKDGIMNNRDREPKTPWGYPVDREGRSLDTDGDDVPDGADLEPMTPDGALVDKRGRGIDGDGDGVYDGIDWEPDTPDECPVDEHGVAIDTDGDGVPDGLDREVNTPQGALVNQDGVSLDEDGDGVPSGLDIEPDTPAGAIVDANGVAFDSDEDGVPDGVDREPETPQGLLVDPQGMALVREEFLLLHDGSIRLSAVYFQHGSAVLTDDSHEVLDEIGRILGKYPTLRIQVEGHTDSYGDTAMNLRLARNRAQAVLDYLLERYPDLDRTRFRVIGYGAEKPIASNSTMEGRQQNRRVEFVVINRDDLPGLHR